MSLNYSKGQPVGDNQVPQFLSPAPVKAIAIKGTTNQVASSVITLTENTTAIEVAAQGAGGVLIRWIAVADTNPSVFGITSVGATNAPNFDHAVTANTVRRFVVPIESQNNSQGYSSMVGDNRSNGLYQRVAVVSSGGISSVIVTEYGKSNSY